MQRMAGETPRRRGTLVPQRLRRRRKAREGRRELWEICRSQSIDFLSSTPHDRMTGANSSTPARAGHPDMATAQQQGSCWTGYRSWRTSTHRPAYVRWRCCARQSAGKTPSRRADLHGRFRRQFSSEANSPIHAAMLQVLKCLISCRTCPRDTQHVVRASRPCSSPFSRRRVGQRSRTMCAGCAVSTMLSPTRHSS